MNITLKKSRKIKNTGQGKNLLLVSRGQKQENSCSENMEKPATSDSSFDPKILFISVCPTVQYIKDKLIFQRDIHLFTQLTRLYANSSNQMKYFPSFIFMFYEWSLHNCQHLQMSWDHHSSWLHTNKKRTVYYNTGEKWIKKQDVIGKIKQQIYSSSCIFISHKVWNTG